MKYFIPILFLCTQLEAKPHVHQQAKLMLALGENQKSMDLVFELPTVDVFGFESFSPARLEGLEAKSLFLKQPLELLEFSQSLGCTQSLVAAKAFDIDLLSRPLKGSVYDSSHADLELSLRVECKSSLLSNTLNLRWPSWLERIKKVELTYLGSSKQDRKTLSPSDTSFRLD